MKFYWRDPDAAFAGMAGLTLEQIGAYNLVIDLLYARDGVVPDDDDELARALHLDPRQWRRVKRELMTAGKIRTTRDGMLDANGVASRLLLAKVRSTSAKHAADVRWTNHRKAKEINEAPMRPRNATKTKNIDSSTNSESGAGETADGSGEPSWPASSSSKKSSKQKPQGFRPETVALMRAKGWI
jgi:uncharacterized protein YdaU (DUF1376 family)